MATTGCKCGSIQNNGEQARYEVACIWVEEMEEIIRFERNHTEFCICWWSVLISYSEKKNNKEKKLKEKQNTK